MLEGWEAGAGDLGVPSPSITSESCEVAAWQAALLGGSGQDMVSWVAVQGGRSVREVLLTGRAQRH